MKITTREIECEPDTVVKIWCECRTPEDIENMIAWLRFAQRLMRDTIKLNEKTALTAKAAAGQNETRRQVSGSASVQERADGQYSIQSAKG
jgi:hypothetical protein